MDTFENEEKYSECPHLEYCDCRLKDDVTHYHCLHTENSWCAYIDDIQPFYLRFGCEDCEEGKKL